MDPIVQDRLEDVRRLCENRDVLFLDLIGSAAEDRFDLERSDLDFLVEFRQLPLGGRADAYFGLLNDFRDLFGREIDLVEDPAIRNRYFREYVNKTKVPLYAAGT